MHACPAKTRCHFDHGPHDRGHGGFTGMFFIGGLGFLGVAFAFIVGFFPPHNLPIGNPALYVGLVAGGLCTFLAMPLLIQAFKKPRWKLQTKAENSV